MPKQPETSPMTLRGRNLCRRTLYRQAKSAAIKAAKTGTPIVVPSHDRPRTRGECRTMPRPCPFVGCRYHLFLSITQSGALLLPHGEDVTALERMADTCALDVAEQTADSGEMMPTAELAKIFNMTRFGVTKVWSGALAKLGLHHQLTEHGPPDARPQHKDRPKGAVFGEAYRRRRAAQSFVDGPAQK